MLSVVPVHRWLAVSAQTMMAPLEVTAEPPNRWGDAPDWPSLWGAGPSCMLGPGGCVRVEMLRCCLKALPWLALPAVGGHRLLTFPELSGTVPESSPVPAYLPLQGHNPVSLQPLPPSGPWLLFSLFYFLNFFNLGRGGAWLLSILCLCALP